MTKAPGSTAAILAIEWSISLYDEPVTLALS